MPEPCKRKVWAGKSKRCCRIICWEKKDKKKDKSSFILVGDTCTPLLAESSHSFTPPTTDNSKLKGWDGAETTEKVRWGQGSSWVGTGCCKPNLHKKTLVTKSFGKEYSSPISNYGACCSIHNKKNRDHNIDCPVMTRQPHQQWETTTYRLEVYAKKMMSNYYTHKNT